MCHNSAYFFFFFQADKVYVPCRGAGQQQRAAPCTQRIHGALGHSHRIARIPIADIPAYNQAIRAPGKERVGFCSVAQRINTVAMPGEMPYFCDAYFFQKLLEIAVPQIVQKYINPSTLLTLWKITESVEELRVLLTAFEPLLFPGEERTRQWLASRVLLQYALEKYGISGKLQLEKDENGKPHIPGCSLQISLSHAEGYAAILLSDQCRVGVDVEAVTPRIARISRRFMNEEELTLLTHDTDHRTMYIVWSAKEALYKWYSQRGLDFRLEIVVSDLMPDKVCCSLQKDGVQQSLEAGYVFLDGESHILSWVVA